MKVNAGTIERALDRPGAEASVFLLYGVDEAGSRALADRLKRALGPEAEQIDIDSAVLKAQPGLLSVEAASTSLFGGARHIRVALAAADDITPAIAELLATPGATNPVVIVGGALRPTNAVVKLALAERRILAFQGYALGPHEAERLAAAMAREAGLKTEPGIARRLATASGGDRAIMAREIEKYALHLDAAPERPATLTAELIDALGADSQDGDFGRLADAVMGGDASAAAAETARLTSEGVNGIPIGRAVARRAFSLLDHVGGKASSGGKPANKWEESARRQADRWSPDRLATALERLLAAERAVKSPGSLGPIALDAELIAISRAARSSRR